jgi:fatty acid hydroxylase family protein
VARTVELREIAIRHGRAKKRNNAIVALLSGALPSAILSLYLPSTWERWLIGLIVGLVWGNAFEYAYHRWLLHRPRSAIGKGHREHHAQTGTPGEAEYVTLGSSPLNVAILFAVNSLVAVPIDFLLSLHIVSGIFAGWTIYIISAEEIHWRIHMSGWLPRPLHFARAYHMSHHDVPNSRYNVFLPLFDWLLGNSALPESRGARNLPART